MHSVFCHAMFRVPLLVSFGLIVLIPSGVFAAMQITAPVPPPSVAGFQQSAAPRVITAADIFNYMNGGGELYLAYRFDRMVVYEYSDPDGQRITAEIYTMRSGADAFGLLSLDWGGDSVDLGAATEPSVASTDRTPPHSALYGGGLLRMWQGPFFIRIYAYTETTTSKSAVLAIGRALHAPGQAAYPPVLGRLPLRTNAGWQIRPERTGFLRSHLVLNSLFYLSHDNILSLDHSVAAVFAPYEYIPSGQTAQRLHLLLVQYPSAERAQAARAGFLAAYLPEQASTDPASNAADVDSDEGLFAAIEDGWLGLRQWQGLLGIVFTAPSREAADNVLTHIAAPAAAKGGGS
ncbi:MAG: hypothetical protein QNJ22_20465 [Desulfosarcinaceae bacterium]|nr:hypothetical protein [Desulfosarcinaceae bacterium]